MTPKEKAQYLVNKMKMTFECTDCDYEENSRIAALIAANEIWDTLEEERVFEQYDYWEEVKQEIEKL